MKTVLEVRNDAIGCVMSGRETDEQVHGHELSALIYFRMVAITTINMFKQYDSRWNRHKLLPVY